MSKMFEMFAQTEGVNDPLIITLLSNRCISRVYYSGMNDASPIRALKLTTCALLITQLDVNFYGL